MTDYGTIKIPREDYEQHNDRRKELGLTWLEYLDGRAPDISNGSEVTPEDIQNMRDEVITTIQAVAGDVATEEHISELQGNISNDAEVDLSPLLGRLDDLEAELPRKVAEELHR